ncbi:MAG: T9SS type A sorting domain-containing protein, partial [Algoriphagus sp.]|nr:T9SS type A sorting domain-containing protein [Algoriphagus sp.]
SGSVDIVINKAPTVTTVTINGGPFTYTGSAITPATVTVTGAGGLNLTPAASYANNINAGTATASYSYEESANHLASSDSKNFTIGKADATIVVQGKTVTYDGTAHGATGTAKGVMGEDLAGLDLGATFTNVPGGTADWTFTDVTGNYNNASGSVDIVINKRAASVSANSASKFCGQADPIFGGTLEGFIESDNVTAVYSRTSGETVGLLYIISAVLSPVAVLSNYDITYNTANFTINGVTIDASASSTPVPMGSPATLRASVTPNVAGVSVNFTVTNEANATVYTTTVLTNGSGIATATTGNLSTIGVLKVTAVAGTGCAESVAYIPVFDASGSFVTGGGWIESPAGAMPANQDAVGKANFGFVSRYKKGSTQVDGNTEFQFNAGGLNFKSTLHESGSLVISGSRATYRGTGTVNGASGFRFMVVAIDGQWNGGTNPDRFRIKITDSNGQVVYDNQIGKDENTADATVLGNNGTGGGSIVIHQASKGNKRVSTELVTVPWNTPVETIKQKVDQMSLTWFESRKLPMTLDASNYDPLTPGFYELKADLIDNEFFALDEPISIQVLVQDKPKALDILVDNSKLTTDLKAGDVLGTLRTIDPVDNIHTYQIGENSDLMLDGDKVIWKGTTVPAQLRLTVFSTDRAGQTISREISLSRELKPGEFFLYPNPAQRETNVMVDLDREATVTIRIYDAVGRMVLENESFREGSFTQTFNLDGLAAGFYTVQVKVGDMVMTKRLIKR